MKFFLSAILITAFLAIAGLFEVTNEKGYSSPIQTQTEKPRLIKSVRVDLSSMDIPDNQNEFIGNIIKKLVTAGANTVYINPWSDGNANYQSKIALQNNLGENNFLETFLTKAHGANLKVFAWFVVGKDDFPSKLHPEWFAKTINGQNYFQEDEPGVFLPTASLANDDYLSYHLSLIKEVNQLPVDGWVISEPVMGWGDRFDPTYIDFSESSIRKFQAQFGTNPQDVFSKGNFNTSLYPSWVSFRTAVVTDFVRQSMSQMRQETNRPIVITLFTEPAGNDNLKSFAEIKDWLGEDIETLANLGPDYLEIQDLFADFEFPQKPEWTSSLVKQFKTQLGKPIPIMVNVQGFNVEADDFSRAMQLALDENVAGVSFYALHTLPPQSWVTLQKLWK